MTQSEAIESAEVVHNTGAQQFELRVAHLLCIVQYRLLERRMVVFHTEVPEPIRNRGLAERMTRAALEFARSEKLKVEPRCPFTAAFLRRHPEYSDLI